VCGLFFQEFTPSYAESPKHLQRRIFGNCLKQDFCRQDAFLTANQRQSILLLQSIIHYNTLFGPSTPLTTVHHMHPFPLPFPSRPLHFPSLTLPLSFPCLISNTIISPPTPVRGSGSTVSPLHRRSR